MIVVFDYDNIIPKGGDILSQSFWDLFENSLRAVVNDNSEKTIVPERNKVLGDIFIEMYNLFGVTPKIKMFPNFYSGSVGLELPKLTLKGDSLKTLVSILSKSDSFEILPTVTGVKIASSVNRVFEEA